MTSEITFDIGDGWTPINFYFIEKESEDALDKIFANVEKIINILKKNKIKFSFTEKSLDKDLFDKDCSIVYLSDAIVVEKYSIKDLEKIKREFGDERIETALKKKENKNRNFIRLRDSFIKIFKVFDRIIRRKNFLTDFIANRICSWLFSETFMDLQSRRYELF